jgi:predicted DsbA family dithiol-disulfide isomerase
VRLAQIEDEYGDEVEVVWKSFLLRPSPHPRSLEEHREYTRSWLRPAEQPESGEFNVWATDHEPPSHSVPALVAGKAAASFGEEAFRAFHVGIMAAYFEENRTISDPGVILDVVEKSGISVEEFRERLERDRSTFEDEVFAEHTEAVSLGVTGIPSVVVDDALLIPGAVGTDIYRQVIKKRQELRGA